MFKTFGFVGTIGENLCSFGIVGLDELTIGVVVVVDDDDAVVLLSLCIILVDFLGGGGGGNDPDLESVGVIT